MNFDFKDLMTFGMFILALLTFIFSNVFQIPEMGTENRPCKNIGVFRAAIFVLYRPTSCMRWLFFIYIINDFYLIFKRYFESSTVCKWDYTNIGVFDKI